MASTLDGVRAHLPNLAITATSKPTETQAQALLDTARDWAASRVGDLSVYTPTTVAAVELTVDRLVEMGAAGLVSNASFPERAGAAGSGYGDWLWTQFLHGLDEVLETLNKPTEEGGAGGGVEAPIGDVPVYSLPEPTFYRDTGF